MRIHAAVKNIAQVLRHAETFGLGCMLAFLLATHIAGAAHAENLVSLQTRDIAPLPAAGLADRLLVIEGKPVAMAAQAAWVLNADRKSWSALQPGIGLHIAGAAGDGRKAFLLLAPAPDGAVDAVAGLTINPYGSGLALTTRLPPLPAPLIAAQGALARDMLHVAGNLASGELEVFSLDLAADAPAWVPGVGPAVSGRITSLVSQANALYATVKTAEAKGDRLFRWTRDGGWTEKPPLQVSVVGGAARAAGQAHILYFVRAGNEGAAQLFSFHTITSAWASLGDSGGADVGAVTGWGNGMLWQRRAPGDGFALSEIESGKLLLSWLDWVVIVVYLVSMLGMGLYFYLREKRVSTSDFFVGGRSIPFWAAGVSLYAANTSSISYIAIPAKAFETNWQYLTNNLVAVVGLMFVAIWIVPLLRRLDLMSVFQYLETRFHPVIRTLASALFIAVQIGSRMSVILFLPSLAIATMTGIDVVYSILIMGVFTMIYTALGGMKAVIWTDFVQLIVKMGGIFFAIGFIVYMLDGGVGELIRTAAAEDKTKLFDFSWDLTKATVWGFVFLVLFDVVLTFPKDQVLMQRVLSTKSDKDAGRSIWTFAAIMIPGGFLFYGVGTALFVYYKAHPERMNPLLTIDATFPLFIAAELPTGIRGLIIAGILAAAMATLSSIMNSVATLASVDFYEKWVKNPSPRVSVRFAEAMTVLTGIIGMGVAFILTRYDIHSLFDISIELAGLLGGGFAGAYTLGMFTRRANWQGVAIGVAVSIVLTTTAWFMKLVHPYFYLAISIFLCIVVGYAASWLFPAPSRASLAGLTIYSDK